MVWGVLGASVRRVAVEDVRPPATPSTPDRLEGPLRIGYVVWDWPALSQTFVINEIADLVERGHDVVVYYRVDADQPAEHDLTVPAHRVAGRGELVQLLREHDRQVLHSPFAYPSTTRLVWPAATRLGIPFTFMAGGVDVAHYENMARNRVGEVASSPLCLGVITLGTFHRDLLLECGVPSNRIVMERQSVRLPAQRPYREPRPRPRLVGIGRFIEKKGLDHLVRAAALRPEVDVHLHGYGPLEPDLRALADELGADNVTFAGPITSAEELEAVYHDADLFVLPSVRAANGDLDGLPTVILEAMAAGVPVVSTRAANIPDVVIDGRTGFLAEPGDTDDLVAALDRALDLDPHHRAALVRAARRFATEYAGDGRTSDTLLRLWRRDSLDIVLVTFERRGYRNAEDTYEIIDRILRFTTLPFSLTVVDNASRRPFLRALERRYGSVPGFRLVPLAANVFCGPASNLGFAQGRAPYLAYVCSNEGFVLRHGWDHAMVREIERTGAAIAGHRLELGGMWDGAGIQRHPRFPRWRHRELATSSPERPFRHVQGGLFVARRDAFEAAGGFNDDVPQDGMDVELSYHLEARGEQLADVPGLVAVSSRTRPPARTLVDEFTVAIHPSSRSEVGVLDDVVARRTRYCTVCGWHGASFSRAAGGRCRECRSTPFGRTVVRVLSESGQLQRLSRTHVVSRDRSVAKVFRPVSNGYVHTRAADADEATAAVDRALADGAEVLVVDRYWPEAAAFADVAGVLADAAARGVLVAVGAPVDDLDAGQRLVDDVVARGVNAEVVELLSAACAFDPFPLAVLGNTWPGLSPQGTA